MPDSVLTPDLLADRIEASLDPVFQTRRGAGPGERPPVLYAWFDLSNQNSLLRLMPLGTYTHSHEHRLLFAEPVLTPEALADWWAYGQTLQQTLTEPDDTHQFTLISLILFAGRVDPAAARRLRSLRSELRYRAPQAGWSSLRLAVVEQSSGRLLVNRAGAPLAQTLKPLLG